MFVGFGGSPRLLGSLAATVAARSRRHRVILPGTHARPLPTPSSRPGNARHPTPRHSDGPLLPRAATSLMDTESAVDSARGGGGTLLVAGLGRADSGLGRKVVGWAINGLDCFPCALGCSSTVRFGIGERTPLLGVDDWRELRFRAGARDHSRSLPGAAAAGTPIHAGQRPLRTLPTTTQLEEVR